MLRTKLYKIRNKQNTICSNQIQLKNFIISGEKSKCVVFAVNETQVVMLQMLMNLGLSYIYYDKNV